MIFNIAMRELRSLFLSPLAWAILAIKLHVLSWIFLFQLDRFLEIQPKLGGMQGAPGLTSLVAIPLLDTAAFLLMLIIPLISMRLISEERRGQTLSLLFSAPVSMTEIILGKYLGILAFLSVMLALIVLMPLSLFLGANLDGGLLASGIIGLFLITASYAAIGLLMSALTKEPLIAAISSFGVFLLLWIIDGVNNAGQNNLATGLFNYLSISSHYQNFSHGIINSADFSYFGLLIITAIILSIRRLDAYRLQH